MYYQGLTSMQKGFYGDILTGLKKMQKEIHIDGYIQFNDMFNKILYEYPELFYVTKDFTMEKSLRGCTIKPCYTYNEIPANEQKQKLNAKANQILLRLINKHQTDYDKVLVLHDYLKQNIEYDNEAAASSDSIAFRDSHTVIGALLNQKCVCAGFSLAMKYLCEKAGVECTVVSGEANNGKRTEAHAWNIVKINGYYHHVDVTWDNQFSSDKEIPNYAYLNVDDDTIMKDHNWKMDMYPKCATAPYNYFYFNKSLIDSQKQLERYIYQNMLDENPQIMFKVREGSSLEKDISLCLERIVVTAAKKCKHIQLKKWKYVYISKQLIYTLIIDYQ